MLGLQADASDSDEDLKKSCRDWHKYSRYHTDN